jgi:hypothetical protein
MFATPPAQSAHRFIKMYPKLDAGSPKLYAKTQWSRDTAEVQFPRRDMTMFAG